MLNIYLIGMMGAGKTAAGKELARLVKMTFLDLDEEIESETRLSINEIFQKKGEPFFRAEERKALARASGQTQTVVATGGGIVLDPRNIEMMRRTGKLIYLAASFETLWSRVRDKRDRPLLAAADPKATFYQLLQVRLPLYEASCTGRVDTEGSAPEAVAKKIVESYLQGER